MDFRSIEQDFRTKVCEKVRLLEEGLGRYRILTPFMFDDGDHLAMVLRRQEERWVIADEGHTYMRLTYDVDERDLQRGTRSEIIARTLSAFSVEDWEGELALPVPGERFGDALYSFIQAVLKISDVTFLTRERVKSTFMEDFRSFLLEHVPPDRLAFNWNDPERDPEGKYVVDCRINGSERPLLVFALPNDDKVMIATICLLQFEKWWQRPSRSLGIFEDQSEINRKVLARFSDVCEKQFSSLAGNKDRLEAYLKAA